MILTSDYKRLNAVFNRSVYHTYLSRNKYYFTVGKFTYHVSFTDYGKKNYGVEFWPNSFHGTGEEKKNLYEQVTGEPFPEDEDINLYFSEGPIDHWAGDHIFDIIPSSNVFQVFASVIKCVESFIKNNQVNCIGFSANRSEPSRVKLYQKIMESYARKGYKTRYDDKETVVFYYICINKDQTS